MNMNRPQGFLFDFGDTLLHHEFFDPRLGNRAVYNHVKNPEKIPFEDIQDAADSMLQEFLGRRDQTMLEIRCGSVFKLLYERFGLALNMTLLESERFFRRGAVEYRIADGIHEILDVLDSHNIRKGIVSNTIFPSDLLIEDLKEFDLDKRFEFVIASCEYAVRKPHPLIFQLAARKLSLSPENIWFCGDTLEYDVKGALAVGMFPVWYNYSKQAGQVDLTYYEITRWPDLISVVDEICYD